MFSTWRWHLDEVIVRINGETHYFWRAVDHEGEVLESFVTMRWNRSVALKFLRKAMNSYGRPEVIVTDRLRSTTILTGNVIFAAVNTSNSTDRLPLPSGVGLLLETTGG